MSHLVEKLYEHLAHQCESVKSYSGVRGCLSQVLHFVDQPVSYLTKPGIDAINVFAIYPITL